jgi:uncharacterized protein with HEPN domain
MPPPEPDEAVVADRIRAQHMLEAAEHALGFAQGRERRDLDVDAMLRRALLNAVSEIGEAASRMTEAGRARARSAVHADCGHATPAGSRLLNVDLDLLWEVTQKDLEPLVEALRTAFVQWPLPGDADEVD